MVLYSKGPNKGKALTCSFCKSNKFIGPYDRDIAGLELSIAICDACDHLELFMRNSIIKA